MRGAWSHAVTLHSAIYTGHVRHRRQSPSHAFTFPLFMIYLDLSELDGALSMTRLWGRSAFCPARFRRQDYLSRNGLSLEESVRHCVREQLGRRPEGPIRMLTHLRYFGHIFNPVTFYYCFDNDERVTAIVAEITNTPWKERRAYVLDADELRRTGDHPRALRWRFDKDFHVSPFLPMDLRNDWTFTVPGPSLFVHMTLRRAGPDAVRTFDATLRMDRRELTPRLLRGLLVRYPFLTVQVITSIYLEALKLRLKGAAVFAHPGRNPTTTHTPPLRSR
ncbi:MAG: DUF1365 domain-containing protein [Phycisphaerales bacterium]|nr:DUF1365 domain-containing protein [Phycisphaerales bacterium]